MAETVDTTRKRLLAAGRPWTVCRGCDRPLDRHAPVTRPPSMVEHDVAVARVGRLLGADAPPMRAPTRLERLWRRLTGRYPWSYVDARLDWADAVLDVVEPHGRIRGRRA